jgi:hypothetical protein
LFAIIFIYPFRYILLTPHYYADSRH